ncbi:MAG: dephospho-CoA kinase [Propionibacteriaceae bacterium]|nr:dephospho-CoA kinase [Propionibacteriaceae bacterium]
MLRVGLTGGIGSGKSAVADLLAGHGAVIIDADQLAREVVEPGTPGLRAVAAEFGAVVLTAEGRLDRAALAAVVFSDPQARARLERIVHPAVRELAAERELSAPPGSIVVHVIPLLVETGQAESFDIVVVVDVEPAVQRARLAQRDGLSESQIAARIAAQSDRQGRLQVADDVIDNSGDRESLASAVAALWERLVSRRGDLAVGAR